MPVNAHPDSTFSSHVHNDWTQLQLGEYPQPDIRGPMPVNAHPDSTFSSFIHNDWTQVQTDAVIRGPSGGQGSVGSNHDVTVSTRFPQNHFPVLEMPAEASKEGEGKGDKKESRRGGEG